MFAPFSDVVIVGDASLGGAYLLRLRVKRPLSVQFGKFQNGEPIVVPQGELLYLGSAMRSLASRMLRHTLRTGDKPNHSFQKPLLMKMREVGLVNGRYLPPTQKKTHWHIDYLLDETAVTLTHAVLIRSQERLESRLGAWLLAQPEIVAFAPGLGASDVRSHTHILALSAYSGRFWERLRDAYLIS